MNITCLCIGQFKMYTVNNIIILKYFKRFFSKQRISVPILYIRTTLKIMQYGIASVQINFL